MSGDSSVKMFSHGSLFRLIESAEDESKAVFDDEQAELTLSMFLLVRKAFNEAYDKVKHNLTRNGVVEIGELFTGVTGNYVRGSYTERGGAKYKFTPEPELEIDSEFITVETKYKLNTKNIDKYVKENGELPPGVTKRFRNKSMSLSPRPEAKVKFESFQNDDSLIYDLEIPRITEEGNEEITN